MEIKIKVEMVSTPNVRFQRQSNCVVEFGHNNIKEMAPQQQRIPIQISQGNAEHVLIRDNIGYDSLRVKELAHIQYISFVFL